MINCSKSPETVGGDAVCCRITSLELNHCSRVTPGGGMSSSVGHSSHLSCLQWLLVQVVEVALKIGPHQHWQHFQIR